MPTQAPGLPDSTTNARAEQVHGKLVPDPSGPCRPRRSAPSPSARRPGISSAAVVPSRQTSVHAARSAADCTARLGGRSTSCGQPASLSGFCS